MGAESTYYTNIFSYATCVANLPPSDSAVLNALFFAGFGLGRASGIFLTKFVKPAIYIMTDSAGVLAVSILLVIYNDKQKMLWVMGLNSFRNATLHKFYTYTFSIYQKGNDVYVWSVYCDVLLLWRQLHTLVNQRLE